MKKSKIIMVAVLVVGITMGVFAAGAGAQVRSGIGIKAGYFMPGDADVNTVYGSGLVFGADYLFLLGPSYGIDVGVDYFSQEALGLTTWTVIPITGSLIYVFGGGNLYIGAGGGYYTAEMTIPGDSESHSAFGYHALAGISLGPQFFIEGKYSYADVEGIDAGGISIFGGIRL